MSSPIPTIVFGMEQRGPMPAEHGADPDAIMQALRRRMLLVAQFIQAVWVAQAQRMNVSNDGSYVRGISTDARIRTTFTQQGPDRMQATVEVTNTAPHARLVEDGHAAFHLPSRIRWFDPSLRVKHGKNGPYLHIPFRHYTPPEPGSGATNTAIRHQMPDEVYQRARRLARRVPTSGPVYAAGGFTTPDGHRHAGQMFQQAHTYRWQHDRPNQSRRLSHGTGSPVITVGPDGVAEGSHRGARGVAGGGVNPAWQANKYEGLMKTGPAGHTRYLTVRTITPQSKGWWIPARAGLGIRRMVLLTLRHGEGARRLQAMLGDSLIEEVR